MIERVSVKESIAYLKIIAISILLPMYNYRVKFSLIILLEMESDEN